MTAEESPVPVDSTDVQEIMQTPTDWIEDRLNEMTLEEKIGQLMMSRANGYYVSSESDQFQRLVHLVSERKVGGLVFFQGDVHTTAVMINQLQQLAKVPLLIAADFEWGSAMRIRRATRFPEAMALGATRDTLLAFLMAKAIAKESRAIGIHQIFAPVADVNVNPDNPVINTRSFGEHPKLVADMASALTHGLQAGGVIATAKHFPGHGDTRIDSHIGLPTLNVTQERLDSVELFPFRRLVRDGVLSIMVAHLDIPQVSGKKGLPATLTPEIQYELLQKRLGFDGLTVTDALDMGTVVNQFGSDSIAIKAIDAGADVLLILPDEDAAAHALMTAVQRGRISEARINHSVRKILTLKQWVGLDEKKIVDVENISNVVATPSHLQLAKDIARSSITLLKNDNVVPLERFGRKKILNVIVSDVEDYRTEIHRPTTSYSNERVGDYFTAQLRRRTNAIVTVQLNPSSNLMVIDSIVKLADNSDIILLPIFSKTRSGSGKIGLAQPLIDAVNRLIKRNKPSIIAAMGSPYVVRSFADAQAYLCSYSDAEAVTEATVEALFGEIPLKGRLPVTIPAMFPYGSGIVSPQFVLRRDLPESVGFDGDRLAAVDSIIKSAIKDSAFPGAQLVIVKDGAIVTERAYGMLEYGSTSSLSTKNSIYDVASLTKVVATTSAVMKLYDEGKLGLDDLVVKYIPEFGNRGKSNITLRNLLLHNAGLPAFKRLYLTCTSSQEALDSVYNTELTYQSGDSTVYSDFGFIVLGNIVQRITGTSLDTYIDSVFFKPLGMMQTMFNPPESLWAQIAPTELDTLLRKSMVRGVVHDENAWMLGGISGHAGLFSTASDLAIFMQMLMSGGRYGGKQYLKPETITLFTTKQSKKSTRALGWDIKTVNGYSSAGSLFSETSFGHTGFTGTSIWTDPEKKIFVILLTNRVHPTRNNPKIMQIRPAVHDEVMRALD
ncbi:MAG: serine hydrolase [Ignavibacteriae bacterium]|nr:serine hydrolase [Ignavibacteriota bacterium]